MISHQIHDVRVSTRRLVNVWPFMFLLQLLGALQLIQNFKHAFPPQLLSFDWLKLSSPVCSCQRWLGSTQIFLELAPKPPCWSCLLLGALQLKQKNIKCYLSTGWNYPRPFVFARDCWDPPRYSLNWRCFASLPSMNCSSDQPTIVAYNTLLSTSTCCNAQGSLFYAFLAAVGHYRHLLMAHAGAKEGGNYVNLGPTVFPLPHWVWPHFFLLPSSGFCGLCVWSLTTLSLKIFVCPADGEALSKDGQILKMVAHTRCQTSNPTILCPISPRPISCMCREYTLCSTKTQHTWKIKVMFKVHFKS